ncbi:MAG: hypothetical protein COA36_03215 [Desulfotalea sp.]|nr:MAG: hypothetical protein COA36_03215 [Desulfotalea sp.]
MGGTIILRSCSSLFFASLITLSLCLLAPIMGHKTEVVFIDPLTPIRLTPAPKQQATPPKKQQKPQTIAPLPKLPAPPSPKQPPLKKITALMRPLQVELPPLRAASIPSPPLPDTATLNSGFAAGIFDLSAVDTPPRVQKYIPPLYPAKAKGKGLEGSVVIRCIVTPKGRVRDMRVISSEPSGYFDRAALKAVAKWTFIAAKAGGKRVAVYVDIPITFTLDL